MKKDVRRDKSASRSKSPLNRSAIQTTAAHSRQRSNISGKDKSPIRNDRYGTYKKEQVKGTAAKRYDSGHSSSKSPNKTASRINGSSHAVGSSILKNQPKYGSNVSSVNRSYNYLSSFGTAFKKNLAAQNSRDKSPLR